jgi:DNA-binding PadR family transcriptional regulator
MTSATKRFNLVLPEELVDEVQTIADRHHTTVLEILRRFVKLGLLVAKAEESPDKEFLLREGGKEQRLLLL